MPVDEVWGIGAASAAKLARIGVQTAADLAALDPDNARALMNVTGWPHGLRAARDLLPAAGADGAHQEGNRPILPETTNDTGEVVALAVRLGERLWRDGFRYSKCGVMITELMPETIRQPALWGELDREKRERAWRAMDKLNATLGRDTVRILGAGPKDAAWKAQGRASLT